MPFHKPLPSILVATCMMVMSTSACSKRQMHQTDQIIERILLPFEDTTTVAVVACDPESGWSLERNPDRVFHAASTMKIAVLIELFRQAQTGRFDLDDSLSVTTRFTSLADGSTYTLDRTTDSDRALFERVGQPVSLRELAHRMINVSSNLATNLLIEYISVDSVQQTIERLGTRHMQVLRGVEDIAAYRMGLNNTATAADLATLLTALTAGQAVGKRADREMLAILEEQRFNEMIPAGLPSAARVAHKTGQITAIHHDAAAIHPSGRPPYVLVILTEGFPDDKVSARIGAEITEAVHDAVLRARRSQ